MPLAWYIVHAHSGFESRVADAIRADAVRHALADEITESVVPTENVVELRQGKKIETERKFFPGYVLVRMQLSDQTRRAHALPFR